MKIEEGTLAHLFLTNDIFAAKMADSLCSQIPDITDEEKKNKKGVWNITFDLLNPQNQKAYYITPSVIDKLNMLKVGTNKDLDWSIVAKAMTHKKCTYVLPNGDVIRVYSYNIPRLGFALISMTDDKYVTFSSGIAYLDEGRISSNFGTDELFTKNEMLIYKIMCFLYLTENEEYIVPPNSRAGTRKEGKVVNKSNFPITMVTSKWNITSVRTDGFMVSGHFRLQPTKRGHKMIYIEPFEKHGYIRRAKKELN